ncbi:hypothetical protein D9615_009934 [Tricholomella constricta]|uniref:Uncharacterized protein n=1 Tax=Tricholomella constricta TaxID=117010 RepID=A0A8H5GZR7_9AGAR|nr:hypothetical protein D9615_009934 [Tricholomella constricta]
MVKAHSTARQELRLDVSDKTSAQVERVLPIFPQEIINLIVGMVDGRLSVLKRRHMLRRTLKACCLVSWSFRNPAQERLFKALSLGCSPMYKSDTALISALSSSPRLCGFVRSLRIFLRAGCSTNLEPFSTALTHLRHLTLSADVRSLPWTSLPHEFRSNVRDIIRGPSLRSLELLRIQNFPTTVLSCCAHLESLSITHTSFQSSFGESLSSLLSNSQRHGYLRTLTVNDCEATEPLRSALIDPASPLSIARLEQLFLSLDSPRYLPECRGWLDVVGTRLDELHIHMKSDNELFVGIFGAKDKDNDQPFLKRIGFLIYNRKTGALTLQGPFPDSSTNENVVGCTSLGLIVGFSGTIAANGIRDTVAVYKVQSGGATNVGVSGF